MARAFSFNPRALLATALLALGVAARAEVAQDSAPEERAPPGAGSAQEFSGHVRGIALGTRTDGAGPVAAANAVQPDTAQAEPSAAFLQTELRAAARLRLGDWRAHATATAQVHKPAGDSGDATGWINEAFAAGSGAGWQWSVGKKVVSWDVGYGFRPNDVVQQEARRRLTPVTLVGRPVLAAEKFVGDAAGSLVWANPLQSGEAFGASEPALAARYFRRDAAVDWHGFARWGAHTGPSVGAAVAWVATDALELHASWRAFRHADRLGMPAGNSLSADNPWEVQTIASGQQALLGTTWTSAQQVSLLLEAWWDGAAYSQSDWAAWSARNAALPTFQARGAPASAVAGNLAWQAQAFGAAGNLLQKNLFARLSWQYEGWSPALDVLYMPEDKGRMVTAALAWRGDRVELEGGWRGAFGPVSAVARQLPVQRQAFVAATWAL